MGEPARNLQHASIAQDLSAMQNAEMTSASITEELAPAKLRVLAILLDGVFVGIFRTVICAVFAALTHAGPKSAAVALLGFGVSTFYFVFLEFNNGQTLGKKIMKIRVVNDSYEPASFGSLLGRETIGRFLSAVVFCIGYLGAWKDPEHKTWHDKIFKTKVVKA